jgi:V/A-type H+-transporting ATPase subunit E
VTTQKLAADAAAQTAGVQALIERLRQEGIEAGRGEAQALLEAARREAAQLLETARQEAKSLLETASGNALADQVAGQAAVTMAYRDAVLALKEWLEGAFADTLRETLLGGLSETTTTASLLHVLEPLLIQAGADAGASTAVTLSITLDSELETLVQALTARCLARGVTLTLQEGLEPGVRLRLDGGRLEVDCTVDSLDPLLRRHLLPRFRTLLDGNAPWRSTTTP